VSLFFHQYGKNVNQYFHNVFNMIVVLEGEFLVQLQRRKV